ncbi:hypothetical protein ONS95_004459 [Cadophora gregata]|uniref:uncharacterized protein n=1 Tax=Cadophora gregata TaxID=51156 RepID=UPI0026DAF203|nr:uncharacterized protein ONS95_004459 [Cadophora gregata]KAK0105142.1 hypothetical protein ONS96_004544 [Cadophora gregata f. sp. sojae]KAK0105948.1 hypothetical protein ONS95_004459 [Cadophora gregata]
MSKAAESLQQLQKDAVKSIASVSTMLRDAIAAALPVAPEQYLTVAIPGTVIDLASYEKGGSFVYDVAKHATIPTTVRQAEARLVDGMMPVATIMIGNTGRSVARSYSSTLDTLVPAKATISSNDGVQSSGDPNYDNAMTYLKTTVPGTGKSAVELYCEKQILWAKARSTWDTAKIETITRAEKLYPVESDPDNLTKQKEYIANWGQENYFTFKASVQAAWMDWVVTGEKHNVDYFFGMVDVGSIMSRIESSKESLRNSTIPDADGSSEVYGVSLTPSRWATYCQRKAEGWYRKNGTYTLAQLDSEIARLESLKDSYKSAQDLLGDGTGKPVYPVANAVAPTTNREDSKKAINDNLALLYKAQASLSGAQYNLEQKPDDDGLKKAVTEAQAAVSKAQGDLRTAEATYQSVLGAWNEYNRMVLTGAALTDAKNGLGSRMSKIDGELTKLNALRVSKLKDNPADIPVISGVSAPAPDSAGTPDAAPGGTDLAAPGSDLANPIFNDTRGGSGGGSGQQKTTSAEDADPWTTITFSYSASDVSNHSKESEWGMSVGGSVGFGLWSVGGSYSHDESHKEMQSDMAACDVSVSFSALVVNINRPWLYGELFSDVDLDVANNVKLSPGPLALHQMIKDQSAGDIDAWSEFPAYPTSFIVAADTTIEFRGSTKHIEQHFDSHSNSGGASVGYGPFSVSSSFHESASESSMQVQTTATGCKLSFGAPQIIAWVSQILPPLPREKGFNPLSQGAGLPVCPGYTTDIYKLNSTPAPAPVPAVIPQRSARTFLENSAQLGSVPVPLEFKFNPSKNGNGVQYSPVPNGTNGYGYGPLTPPPNGVPVVSEPAA